MSIFLCLILLPFISFLNFLCALYLFLLDLASFFKLIYRFSYNKEMCPFSYGFQIFFEKERILSCWVIDGRRDQFLKDWDFVQYTLNILLKYYLHILYKKHRLVSFDKCMSTSVTHTCKIWNIFILSWFWKTEIKVLSRSYYPWKLYERVCPEFF